MSSAPPTDTPAPPSATAKPRPPASLFALGHEELPAQITAEGITWNFARLFKHDFFAVTALYERCAPPPAPEAPEHERFAVLKVQRTYPFYGIPLHWLGKIIAGHEIRVYRQLQGVTGIPAFLGTFGTTGFLHAFIPGTDLHAELPLTPEFFARLEKLFHDLHERHIAYVDSNKRENILYDKDAQPWLIDFQISFELKRGAKDNFMARWIYRRLARADWYHFYKHKTRLLPSACLPEDFERAKRRGLLHEAHRFVSRPFILVRRKFLSRYDLANTR
jgi:hypothetical protein